MLIRAPSAGITTKFKRAIMGLKALCGKRKSSAQAVSILVCNLHRACALQEQGRERVVIWLQKWNLRCCSIWDHVWGSSIHSRSEQLQNTSRVLGSGPGGGDAEMSQPVRNHLVGRVAWQTGAGWCQVLWESTEGSCLVGTDGKDVEGCCRILPRDSGGATGGY